MTFRKKLKAMVLATTIAATSSANATLPSLRYDNVKPELNSSVVLIENASRAGRITRVLNKGASECASVPLKDRTDCVAKVLRNAASAGSRARFGIGKTTGAIRSASRAMKRLPDDGSASSRAQGQKILDQLRNRIKVISKTRPANYRKYHLEISVSVLKLKKPLRKT